MAFVPVTTGAGDMKDTSETGLRMAVLTLLAVALGSCVMADGNGRGGGGLFGSSSRTVAYRCDDDRRMRVRYEDDGRRAVVDTGSDSYSLRRSDEGGDGRSYRSRGDRDITLAVDGDRANLHVEGGRDMQDCRARD
jgi:hypothetical protein